MPCKYQERTLGNATQLVGSSNLVVEMNLECKCMFHAKVNMWYCVPHPTSPSSDLLLQLLSVGFLASVLLVA